MFASNMSCSWKSLLLPWLIITLVSIIEQLSFNTSKKYKTCSRVYNLL